MAAQLTGDGLDAPRELSLAESPARPGARHGSTAAVAVEAWTQWDVEWRAPAYGAHELLARATDVAGRTQPAVAAWNDNGYFFDAVVRHPVTVV